MTPPTIMTSVLDTRGMRCPWPALRLARVLRDGTGRQIEVLADDPAAPRELEGLAIARGLSFEVVAADRFRIGC